MKAVGRLIYTYFTCTRAQRVFSLVGIIVILISFGLLIYSPVSWSIGLLGLTGVASLFIGSSMMPLMFGRMARGHMSRSLPGARGKLLAGALITVLIVASSVPVQLVFALKGLPAGRHGAPPTAEQITTYHHALMQTFLITYSATILLAFLALRGALVHHQQTQHHGLSAGLDCHCIGHPRPNAADSGA